MSRFSLSNTSVQLKAGAVSALEIRRACFESSHLSGAMRYPPCDCPSSNIVHAVFHFVVTSWRKVWLYFSEFAETRIGRHRSLCGRKACFFKIWHESEFNSKPGSPQSWSKFVFVGLSVVDIAVPTRRLENCFLASMLFFFSLRWLPA